MHNHVDAWTDLDPISSASADYMMPRTLLYSLEVDVASKVDAALERERRNCYGEEREGASGGH